MSVSLNATDKRLLLTAGVLLLIIGVATVLLAPEAAQERAVVPSTYASASGGARAAYLLLQQLHYPVTRWEEPPTELKVSNAVLILAEPNAVPTSVEREALQRFVRGGGLILFCGSKVGAFFRGATVDAADPTAASETETSSPAILPSAFTRGAPETEMRSGGRWQNLNGSQLPLYGTPDDPDAILWRVGRGQIVWWRSAYPLTNAGLSRAHNLNLLLNAVSNRPIYWDEYFHGSRTSLWSYIEQTPVKWAILQIAIMLAAILFTYSRRSGPVVMPHAYSRLSPLEFVNTLGSLYQRARAYEIAVGVSYRELRSSLEQRLRLPRDTPDDSLAQAAAERLGWDHTAITSALQAGVTSIGTRRKSRREALRVVRTMERFTARLTAIPPLREMD